MLRATGEHMCLAPWAGRVGGSQLDHLQSFDRANLDLLHVVLRKYALQVRHCLRVLMIM